jgi:soluble lytic murein transglycosylase-like protein
VTIASVTILLAASARGQSRADEDPVARSMRSVEASVEDRARAAEAVLAASKLVNESAAAKKRGDRERAKEALREAEKIAAEADEFDRSALIDELARVVASEQAALNTRKDKNTSQYPPDLSVKIAVPRSVMARMDAYRDTFARILEEERVPIGLLGVALVESGFNPYALSPKGARGIWQFMPATAERYGLAIGPGGDHRTHPEHSTRAAARYLRDLYTMFRDWKLALAGYNAGEGRVQRIIKKTGIRDFDEMSRRGLLPLETRKYVPAVLAAWTRVVGQPLQSNPGPVKAKEGK